MKNLSKIVLIAAFAAISSLASHADAQSSVGYRPTGDDGITASPKLRQMIDARTTVQGMSASAVASIGYRAVGADGIVASPKLRQQLGEHEAQMILVAPLK
jgi:L-fucose isomerase-like protein